MTGDRQALSTPGNSLREIVLAGGCFWGTQEYLSGIGGVTSTTAVYANCKAPNPTYEAVCSHTTGCAEAVRVVYDPTALSLRFLLEMYCRSVNPTSVNRQGGDVGEQYRTGIYYTDPRDLPVIEACISELAGKLDKPIAIEVKPLENCTPAEEYHQHYLKKRPDGYCHIPSSLFEYARHAREYRKSDRDALQKQLTPIQFEVTQYGVTEPPFYNSYNNHFERGIYVDITTGQPLFLSTHKFESGCGWPSFSRPIHPQDVTEHMDLTEGMIRTEVRSSIGEAHLGHVFEDGPKEAGGLRYCINSASLRFVPEGRMEAEGYGHLLPLLEKENS